MALPTPPPLSRPGAEVTTQQEQEDTKGGNADDPKNWISYVEHSQNLDRRFANSGTFKPDGKSGVAPRLLLAGLFDIGAGRIQTDPINNDERYLSAAGEASHISLSVSVK